MRTLQSILFFYCLYSLSFSLALIIVVIGSMAFAQGEFMVTFPHDEWQLEIVLGAAAIPALLLMIWRLIRTWLVLQK